MKNFKRVVALLVAATMLLGLCAVSVFAAQPTNVKYELQLDKATVKNGGKVTLSVYLKDADDANNGSFEINNSGIVIEFDNTKFTATDVTGATKNGFATTNVNNTQGTLSVASYDGTTRTVDTTKPVLIVELVCNLKVTEDTAVTLSARPSYSVMDGSGNALAVTSNGSVTVTVTPSWTANAANATPATATYPIGTDVAAALANDVDIAVTDGTRTEENYTATWECTEANCDLTVPANHTFKGLVAGPIEENAANWEGQLYASVEVTLTALTDGEIQETLPALTKNKTQEAGTYVAADVLADLAAKGVDKVTLKNGAIEDTVTLTAEMITIDPVVDTATLGTSAITVTIPASTTSDNGKFVLAEAKTLTGSIEIIPAEIKDGSVKWTVKSDSTTADGVIEIAVEYAPQKDNEGNDVAVPATDVAAVVNMVLKNGETVVATKNGVELGSIAAGSATAAFKTDSLANIFGAGVPKDGYTVEVEIKLNGASVSYDGVEANGLTKTVYVLAVTADSSTSTGLPTTGGTAGGVTDNTGDDETEEPGTEEPGDVVTGDAAFGDIEGHWAQEYIEILAEAGIVNGKTADTFEPDSDVTRAEFVKMIAVAYNMTATGTETAFEDAQGHWAQEYIIAAAEAGYVTGMSETYFGADENITRQDICTILGRILGAQEDVEAAAFVDAADIADYAAPYVNLLAGMGIVNGYEDGTFAPEANATRAEVAKILVGFLDLNAAE